MVLNPNHGKEYLRPWNMVTILLPFSTVAMQLELAGEVVQAQLLKIGPGFDLVQLWKDGRKVANPIPYSEAGILLDDCGYFTYAPQ